MCEYDSNSVSFYGDVYSLFNQCLKMEFEETKSSFCFSVVFFSTKLMKFSLYSPEACFKM